MIFMDEEILEKLAEIEHEQWCDWSRAISFELESLLDIIDKLEGKSNLSEEDKELIRHVHQRLIRWNDLWVPYDELSEESKEQDRVYARKSLSIFEKMAD